MMCDTTLFVLALMLCICYNHCLRSFSIDYDNNVFLKDGKHFRYISGSIHYMRIPRDYWDDRLYKMRKAGLNAIQVYVPWNLHEPFPGYFQFSGQNDLLHFLDLAQKHDLLVILRPGPYICAEWDFGGLPYWLLKNGSIGLRSSNEEYMSSVDRYMSVLLTKVKPFLYENDGPIITVQVENEYGSYGCDHLYLTQLGAMFRKYLGDSVVLFTTDGAGDSYLKCGSVQSIYATVDFGPTPNPKSLFDIQRKYEPKGPLVNSEFYVGWLDHWGSEHSRADIAPIINSLDQILSMNASVNMYMFHGGTNFGFMNGANAVFSPQPTSYDYDAPISEAGDPTKKYFAIQNLLSNYTTIPAGPQPKPSLKMKYAKVYATSMMSMYDLLNHVDSTNNSSPLTFEELDMPYGYVLYRVKVVCNVTKTYLLNVTKFHDRAYIMLDEEFIGLLQRNTNNTLSISCNEDNHLLDILVENQGRINYGGSIVYESKGLLGDVLFERKPLSDWTMFYLGEHINSSSLVLPSMSLSNPVRGPSMSSSNPVRGPAFYFFNLDIQSAQDTFLKLDLWKKGVAVLNRLTLGRYWWIGPQQTLYVPATAFQPEKNMLSVFETERVVHLNDAFVEFVETPILDQLK